VSCRGVIHLRQEGKLVGHACGALQVGLSVILRIYALTRTLSASRSRAAPMRICRRRWQSARDARIAAATVVHPLGASLMCDRRATDWKR
jgi:hypothetical protein